MQSGGREEGVSPTPSPAPSPRVQLEVAVLDADQAAAAPAPPSALDDRTRLTVLVVAAEADLRQYVRECLREHSDLRLLEAATVAAAVALAAHEPPDLLIVDEPERGALALLPHVRTICIVDEVPHDAAAPGARVRLLARPFTAERLMDEVGRLLG